MLHADRRGSQEVPSPSSAAGCDAGTPQQTASISQLEACSLPGPTGMFYASLAPLMKGGQRSRGFFTRGSLRVPRRGGPACKLLCTAVKSASPLKIGSLTPACQNLARCEKLRYKGTNDTVPQGKNRLPLCLPSQPRHQEALGATRQIAPVG